MGFDVSLIVADGLGDENKDGVSIYDVGKAEGRKERFLIANKKVYLKAKSLNCNIYHFHDPELMFYALKLKKLKKKVIYDIHEDLVQQLKIRPWINKYLKPLIIFSFEKFENYICKKMDALIVPQPYMKDKFLKLNKDTEIVANFVILETEESSLSEKKENSFALHAGALSKERGLFNMINAYSKINIISKLVLAGNIKEDTLKQARLLDGWEKVEYLGVIKHEKVNELYKNATVGLILYNNVGQYHLSFAIKLFEYMKNSIAVVMPNFGEWVSFNKENNCGINVDPTNAEEVANAIENLIKNPEKSKALGKNGYKAVVEKYNWGISEKNLFVVYDKLLEA